jgi:hypothetical protein
MGLYNKGILGAFSGKVGPVVGASWRGKEILRSLPRKGNRIATETQLLQRLKFKTVSSFLTPLAPIISRYFGSGSLEKTRTNQAMSYHMTEAVTYVDPNFDIIFEKVVISKGDLLGFQSPNISSEPGTTIHFTWENNSGQGQAKDNDRLIIAVYEATTKATVYSLDSGRRIDGAGNIILPNYLSGLTAQVWIAFVSENQKLYATSVYMGEVVLT